MQRVAELQEPRFGRRIYAPSRPGVQGADGRDVDDHAAPPLRHYPRDPRRSQNRPRQVRRDDVGDARIFLLGQRRDLPAKPRIVHQHVNGADFCQKSIPVSSVAGIGDKRLNADFIGCRGELLALVRADIRRLRERGAAHILIACCTASTIYPLLDEEDRRLCTPILRPAASAAVRRTKNRRVGVIATEATVRSGAFATAIRVLDPTVHVFSYAAQSLVDPVEKGARDDALTERDRAAIRAALLPFEDSGIDTLILGCTHFSHIRRAIEEEANARLRAFAPSDPGIRIVGAAEEGAGCLLANLPKDKSRYPLGQIAPPACLRAAGKVIYLE